MVSTFYIFFHFFGVPMVTNWPNWLSIWRLLGLHKYVNITNVHSERVWGFHNVLRKIVQRGSYFGEGGVEMKNLSLQKFTKNNSKKLHLYNSSYWPHLILGPLWTFSTLNIRVFIIPLSQPIRMKRLTPYSESLFHIGPHRGLFLIGQSSKKILWWTIYLQTWKLVWNHFSKTSDI